MLIARNKHVPMCNTVSLMCFKVYDVGASSNIGYTYQDNNDKNIGYRQVSF